MVYVENLLCKLTFFLSKLLILQNFSDQDVKDLRMPRASAPFRGTTRYAPLAALRQLEQSRKDDIEAWLYMIVEWTSGQLPWRKLKGTEKEDVQKWKEDARSGDALDKFLTDCPKRQFTAIMQYIDCLVYQSIPDYDYVHYCLAHACRVNDIDPHESLDWDPSKPYNGPTKSDRDKRMIEVNKDQNVNLSLKELSITTDEKDNKKKRKIEQNLF